MGGRFAPSIGVVLERIEGVGYGWIKLGVGEVCEELAESEGYLYADDIRTSCREHTKKY